MALIDKLTAIADAIRGKTGGTDALTLDQMATEIAGIESGGGGLTYDMGEFVLDADTANLNTDVGIPHALGEAPEFVLVWTDDFADLTADNVSTQQVNIGYIILSGFTGMSQRLSSTTTNELSLSVNFYLSSGDYRIGISAPTSLSYGLFDTTIPSVDKIPLFKIGTNWYWRAGVTYKYFVSKAWWNVGGVANAE